MFFIASDSLKHHSMFTSRDSVDANWVTFQWGRTISHWEGNMSLCFAQTWRSFLETQASREKIGTSRLDMNSRSTPNEKQRFCPTSKRFNVNKETRLPLQVVLLLQCIAAHYFPTCQRWRHIDCLRNSMLDVIVCLEHRRNTLGFTRVCLCCCCSCYSNDHSKYLVKMQEPGKPAFSPIAPLPR